MRTLSREGNAATVTRRRTDRPQWYQGAGMNGSDLEKNRDLGPKLTFDNPSIGNWGARPASGSQRDASAVSLPAW